MAGKLFCQLCPLTYQLSTWRMQGNRWLSDRAAALTGRLRLAGHRAEPLPVVVYAHRSLILRTLGGADPVLQQHKKVNLSLSAPKVDGILIRPGETFSFWHLVGRCSARAGYQVGLVIRSGQPDRGVGGGMCQFTNLIHWMALHSPLTITERHHHDGLDLFPDHNRQVPFGTGTSILWNYLDYRLTNNTGITFQLCVRVAGDYLEGELRASEPLPQSYHVFTEGEGFVREDGQVFRVGRVYRRTVDKRTGNTLSCDLIQQNHARVCYDPAFIAPERFLDGPAQKSSSGACHE